MRSKGLPSVLVSDHMVDFLGKHNLLKDTQHGFLRGWSCLTNLLEYTEIISKWVDDGSPMDAIYLDFQKAFDKVPHQRLLIKLKSHGMGVNIVTWRQQRQQTDQTCFMSSPVFRASDRQRTVESIFVSCVYSMRDITYCLMYFGGSMVSWLQYNLSFK